MSAKSINLVWRVASTLTLGMIRTRVVGNKCNICLSFDDGPHPEHTPVLLDLLKKHGVRACFFVIGSACEKHPELIERICSEGHSLGNHSMTHPRMGSLSMRQQWEELASLDRIFRDRHKLRGACIRPPYGEVTLAIFFYSLLYSRGLVLWTKDSLDGGRNAAEIIQRFESFPITAGDRILFHDDAEIACEALTKLLPEWKRQGFCFETDVPKSICS